MKQTKLTFLFLLLVSSIFAQNEYTISGYIKDASSGETLIGASVFVSPVSSGTTSNEYGFYSITIPEGTYTIEWAYLGFESVSEVISLTANVKRNIELGQEELVIEEIVVVAEEEDKNIQEIQMSVNKLDIATINKIPTLLGETEILRSIQLLPGVTSVGEGAAGFNVRGGSIDQNLVLMDEAPVYNSSHLFGFFSVFNPDAIKDVKLYKGGIPARYGGRLSSILDVRLKEGNSKHFSMQGGIGSIFSRLAIEAPIIPDQASFIVAGRRSYIDVLSKPFTGEDLEGTVLNFYDLTLKANYRLNENNQFFLSGYFGRDNFGLGDNAGFNWGNSTATARWNHLFNDRLFSNLTLYYSNYDYKINFGDDDMDRFDWDAKIINYSVKPEFSYYIRPTNLLRFGGQSILYEFQPANAVAITNSVEVDISLDKQYAIESNVFIENEIDVTPKLKANYGLRLSHFNYTGRGIARTYGEADPGEEKPFESEEFFDDGESIQRYTNLEPRASLKYQINNRSSVKLSYNRMAQYIHLLSNTTASTPVDIWTPSTNNIRPQMADQIAAGYFRNFNNNMWETSIEGYYKTMDNLIDYIDGADLILNEFLEGQILEGEGRAYGMELLIKKNKGRFTGWLSYTLARTERFVPGINNNEWYPSRFDQTHNFSISGFYNISDRLTLSSTFVYNTGTPTTFASTRFEQQGFVIPNNDSNARNNVRIPDYHRLDVSLTLDGKNERNKKWKGQWVFGIYNVYSRRNAFSIYFQQETDRIPPSQPITTEAIRLSVIGNFIPAVSYNFTFNKKNQRPNE